MAGAKEVELLPLSTKGDREKDRALLEIGGKGLFTKEIEGAVLDGRAHIAMHSLKDMPVNMPDGLMFGGVLPREDASDWLISHSPLVNLDELAKGAVIGTSSPRRAAQMLLLRPDVKIVPFRGNVPTRLKKVEEGEVSATILAAAGLKRLNLKPRYALRLPCLPAIGQGIVAMQCGVEDVETIEWLQKLSHQESFYQAKAERALLAAIEGDCHTPLAAHAEIEGEKLTLTAQVLSSESSESFHATHYGLVTDAVKIGQACATELLPKAQKLWQ